MQERAWPSPLPGWLREELESSMQVDDRIRFCTGFVGMGSNENFTAHGTCFCVSRDEEDFVFDYLINKSSHNDRRTKQRGEGGFVFGGRSFYMQRIRWARWLSQKYSRSEDRQYCGDAGRTR